VIILSSIKQKSMSITNELTKALHAAGLDFQGRAIAREIDAMLHDSKTLGRLTLNATSWAAQWLTSVDQIWSVIQQLEARGFWQIQDELQGQVLSCPLITGSSKAIGKTKKRANMSAVKKQSSEHRAVEMGLSDTDLGQRSMMREIVECIPAETRFIQLSNPYEGWLPSDRYAAIGMIFRPETALIEKLKQQFTSIDMDLALSLMYEDLRECPHHRPSVATFGYWMPKWIKNNQDRLTLNQQQHEQSAKLDSLLDDY
jgi:hypothetical protein